MKRKKPAAGTLLFNWKRIKEDDDDNDTTSRSSTNLKILLTKAPQYSYSITIPYELLLKIFTYLIDSSEDPLNELCGLARVCECWRQIVLQTPTLWKRIDLTHIHATEANLKILNKILTQNGSILNNIKEIAFQGVIAFKDDSVERLLKAPNVKNLSFKDMNKFKTNRLTGVLSRSIKDCKLQSLTISNSKVMLGNQKWLSDYLIENGQQLEILNLAMSLTSVSIPLFRSVGKDFCPNLRVLDFSTCDSVITHSFDAIQLTVNIPNLRILRLANVSFRRVHETPIEEGLTKLEELSMPIAMRDPDRDDPLFATLAFSSNHITVLDLRGCSISAFALMDLPSANVRELHIDDMCPIQRSIYPDVIERFSSTLEVLSLVKINCSETIKKCLEALYKAINNPLIRELDLRSSDVNPSDLACFLKKAKNLKSINLNACRSLPRGCKNSYTKEPSDITSLDLSKLLKTLEKIRS